MACNSIAEVRGGEVQLYKTMGYDKFLTEREERAARAMAEWQAMERERAKMQDFVDRMGKEIRRKRGRNGGGLEGRREEALERVFGWLNGWQYS